MPRRPASIDVAPTEPFSSPSHLLTLPPPPPTPNPHSQPAFITLNASSWPTPIVLQSGRAVTLASASPAAPSTLHFPKDDQPALVLTPGASLALRSLILRGLGPVPEPGSGYRHPHAPSLPFGKGDVAVYSRTSIALENVTAYIATTSCDALAGGKALGVPVGAVGGGASDRAPASRLLDPVQAIPRLGNVTRQAPVVGGVNETQSMWLF